MNRDAASENRAPERPTRRTALAMAGAAAAGFVGASWAARRWGQTAPVFVARNQRYDGDLATALRDGLRACDLKPESFRGKRVLLKPNLVEPSKHAPHMTTHPAVIVAAVEVFAGWGAEVSVGEAPGHMRDTRAALEASGVGAALSDAGVRFADLNYEEVAWRPNGGGRSRLPGIYLPRTVCEADVVVSLPKLKTHHWVGMTAAMKNFYGVLPGIKYGWPKNVLHHHGIPETVVDINCTLPATLAIVDAIDCMEGDGPILGSLKPMGLVLVGARLASVDATAARIMGLEPSRVSYLRSTPARLGPIAEPRIEQRGEAWESVASPFVLLPHRHLQQLRRAGDPRLQT